MGIILSDSGKQRLLSRFVSIAAVFDALEKLDSSWKANIRFSISKYTHNQLTWSAHCESEPDSFSSLPFSHSNNTAVSSPTSAITNPFTHTCTHNMLTTGMSCRNNFILFKVRQYKSFMDDWEGNGNHLGSEDNVHTISPVKIPLRIQNWKMKVAVSKVVGREFIA